MSKTTFIAAGDAFITRPLSPNGYRGFGELQACIKSHDVCFLNLESTFHDREGYPAAVSGGTWAMSDPALLDDIKRYGFNLFTTANNHSCDYSHGGVSATIRHLRERGMVFSGTGNDLGEASRACYLETDNARVALISACASFNIAAPAGDQTQDLMGRPGLNPLRHKVLRHLDPEHFAMAKTLAAVSGVNVVEERKVKNGYGVAGKENELAFGTEKFVLDDHCWIETIPNERDMTRIENEIREARRQADVVLVSIHSHINYQVETNIPAQMLETFSHRCIDAGADVIIGHGPHELQGIERYKKGLILYSIGNFIFQTDTVSVQPSDAYANWGLPLDTKVGAYIDERSAGGTKGYCVQWPIWNAVLPSWTMEDGRLTDLKLYPISLGQDLPRSQKGVPVLSRDEKVLAYLAELSLPYGTKITIENGVGTVCLD